MLREQKTVLDNLRLLNIWSEDLLSKRLFGHHLNRLTTREFFILEERVSGNSVKNIAQVLNSSMKHVNNRCSEIKRIFETGERNNSVMSELAHNYSEFYRGLPKKGRKSNAKKKTKSQ